jgi:8-oxo-dGTP pyrophosphatase MutT (NUDIX family)
MTQAFQHISRWYAVHSANPKVHLTPDDISKLMTWGTERSDMNGHVVANGLVLDETLSKVLVIDHIVLGKVLTAGGHIEAGEDPKDAAIREVFEETGIRAELLSEIPIDIDVHTIPANPKKNEGEHQHCCLSFLMRALPNQKINHQIEEVHSAKWMDLITFSMLAPENMRAINAMLSWEKHGKI